MTIRTVFFDVGETLIDESRQWGLWADWLGVPRLTFFAMLGAMIARCEDHRGIFSKFRPGFDLAAEREARRAAGDPDSILAADLYPDVVPSLAALRAAGYRIGIAGNQPRETEALLRGFGVPADIVASSASWGVAKPAPAFFARIVQEAGAAPGEIAYVGDRLDNDVLPAQAAGMHGIFVRRGPWGHVQAMGPEAHRAKQQIDSLAELLALLGRLR